MTSADDDLAAALEALKAEYRDDLARQVREVTALWSQAHSAPFPAGWTELARALHQIAGAAGTFGFEKIGAIAREADTRIVAWRDRGTPPDAGERGGLGTLIRALEAEAAQA